MMIKHFYLLGIRVSLIDQSSVITVIESLLAQKPQIQIVTPNPEHLIQAQQNPQFKSVLNQADLAIPDGIGVVLAIKYKAFLKWERVKIERVTGVDLMLKLCQLALDNGWQVGFLGGKPGVAQLAVQTIYKLYPRLSTVVMPAHNQIQNPEEKEETKIIQATAQHKIQVLFVAYGAPFQELWLNSNLPKLKSVKIGMGVGGAFDFLAGKVSRAPVLMQKLGLEWFYRLVREPWRLKRQLRLIEFAYRVLLNK